MNRSKIKSRPPSESEPSNIDLIMNITDVLIMVTGFQGLPYFGLRCPTTQICPAGPNGGNSCKEDADCKLPACPYPLSRRTSSGR